MKKALFVAVASLFLIGCFGNCATNPRNENLIGPTEKNIKNIRISYYDWERAENKTWNYFGSDEYYDTFFELDVDQQHWSFIIKELKKLKKKVGIFTYVRNPGGMAGSITVIYNDGKETYVYLSRMNYFQINNVWYHYGHGPSFGFMWEMIEDSGIPRKEYNPVPEKADFVILSHTVGLRLLYFVQGDEDNHEPKPPDYEAVIVWSISDTPPDNPDKLDHFNWIGQTYVPLIFDETEKGKTVWVAVCWEDKYGNCGAWSEFKSAVIP